MYFVALIAMFTACSEPMEEITTVDYPRAFSPIGLKVVLGTFDKATVSWDAVDDARSYEVELSQGDSLLFNNIVGSYETESLNLPLTGLWSETSYSVRVKSKAFNEGQQDSHWYGIAFRTNAEQIFNAVADDEIKTGQITVRWTPNEEVTHLTVSPGIGVIVLTAEEIAAGMKTLTGLAPVTQYTIIIYNEDMKRGTVTPTTKWRPSGEGVVELSIGDDFVSAITDPENSGKIIYLPEGYTYTWASRVTPVPNITVYGDSDGERPVFTITDSEPLKLNELTADHIRFENVTLESTHGGGYFINQGTNTIDHACDVKLLSFENCRLIGFGRSIVRTQAVNERVDTIQINRCLIEHCSQENGQNYALIQCTAAFEAFPNIIISNTTVNHSYSNFLNIQGGAGQPSGKNVLIENVTFYKTVGSNTAGTDNRYLIDAGNNGPLNITIKNCILGSVRGVGSERGYRMNDAGTMTATDNYTTTDWTTVADAAANPPAVNVPATAYNGSCEALFVDPENGDFRIKDENFAGKGTAGDPRWW